MKKYYITQPNERVNSLCASILDEHFFHDSITIEDDLGKKKTVSAWEVDLSTLRIIRKKAVESGFDFDLQVAVLRNRKKETFRLAKKEEFILGHQSRNKRPKRLKQILLKRRGV